MPRKWHVRFGGGQLEKCCKATHWLPIPPTPALASFGIFLSHNGLVLGEGSLPVVMARVRLVTHRVGRSYAKRKSSIYNILRDAVSTIILSSFLVITIKYEEKTHILA
jgi:hypothetical protein